MFPGANYITLQLAVLRVIKHVTFFCVLTSFFIYFLLILVVSAELLLFVSYLLYLILTIMKRD